MAAPRIDIAKLVGLDKSGMEQRMRRVALAALAALKATAAQKLHSSLTAYNNGLRIGTITGNSAEVELVGTVPNLVEQGMGAGGVGSEGAYDVRTFVLKHGTKSLRVAKDGHLYLRVPFGFTGAQVAAAGGAGALKSAQKLLPTLSGPGKGTMWGGRLGPEAGRLAGLVRKQKTYSRATQSGFSLWRTMSEKPDASRSGAYSTWLSGGVKARKIFEAAQAAIAKALEGVL